MVIKKKNKVFLILILSLSVFVNYQFFFNTYNLFKNDYSKRMLSIYGYCSKEGYGFTKFIYEKYKPENNLKVINGNPEKYVSINGLFYNKNKFLSNNLIILINYDQNLLIDFENYKILEKNKNCYFIEKKND